MPIIKVYNNTTDKILGKKIAQLREKTGLSRTLLADKAGVTQQQFVKYETGKNRITVERLRLIAIALNKPLSFFLDELDSQDCNYETVYSIENTLKSIRKNLCKLSNQDHIKIVDSVIKTLLDIS